MHARWYSACTRVCVCVCARCLEAWEEEYFPPLLEDLLAWSMLFRCPGTWANYCGYVRTAAMLVKGTTEACSHSASNITVFALGVWQVFRHPAVVRAKFPIATSENFASRDRMWIRMCANMRGTRYMRACGCAAFVLQNRDTEVHAAGRGRRSSHVSRRSSW